MPDVLFYFLIALGVVLLGAGIALVVGRERVAKNMKAAEVIPRRVKSSVGYVIGLGVGQMVLGVLICLVAGVVVY